MIFPSQFRKPHRLKKYDYSSANSYLLTFNVLERRKLLSEIKKESDYSQPMVCLTSYGKIAEKHILKIPNVYKGIELNNYVIMPDHVHILLTIGWPTDGKQNIAKVVHSTKRMITNEIGKSIWQLDFYDVIADTPEVFAQCDKYIDDNPAVWIEKHTEPMLEK